MSEAESRIAPDGMSQKEFSRRNFVKVAAGAGAALTAAGIGGVGFATNFARAQNGQPAYTTYASLAPDQILSFAYQLELLEGTFYAQGVQSGLFSGPTLNVITDIRDNEMAHADFLASALQGGGFAVPETPTFTFPDGVFQNPAAFLDLANTFEPVGIGAFQGAAPVLMGTQFLTPALSIHGAECRHWDAVKVLNGIIPPNNVAFEEALPLPAVQEAVAPFGITG